MPLVSIIIPVYNVEQYIRKALYSVIRQSYTNLEIIIVNDCSPDNSLAICKELLEEDNRITIIDRKVNGGLSQARNDGIEAASGKYIYFFDSDDFLDEKAIEKMVLKAEKEELDILGINAKIWERDNCTNYINCSYPDNILCGEDYLVRMIKTDHIYEPVWLYLYRLDIIKENNLRFAKGRLFEDEVWTSQILLISKRVSYLDYAGYNYLKREGSITTSSTVDRKKFIHHSENCHEMFDLSIRITSSENKKLYRDYIARMYMESVKYLNYSDKKEKRLIDYSFIKENIHGSRSVIIYMLFLLNKKLFFKLKGK